MIGGVLTASELALLRTRPQRTLLYIAIPEYKTIYTARVNGTPASNDNTHRIAFDGGVGTLTDIERNMTLMVGTSAGAWDIGLARIRQDGQLGDTYFYIGSTSELDLADDQYITIIDDIGLWPVHPYINASGTMYMDYDIAYANQNVKGPPVPIMGTHAVLELTGASVSATFDASGSYSAIGAPVTYDYLWYVDGVFAGNTASINLSFTAVGTYLVKLVITANYSFCVSGQESISYRYVIVHDCEHPLNSSFTLDSCSGSFSEGGWSYHVTMNARASESYVRDRTLCLLVAEDWYGDTKDSVGLLSGRENIVCVGWVDGESVRRSNDKSMVSFDVQGPAFWLAVQEGFPTGIDDTTAAPVDWSHIQALDPQSGLFSFLHWRTTSTAVMDCWITDDDHRLATTYTPAGSLHEQLRSIAERVNAYTVCDRYGRLFCQIDTQFITPASRTFPVVQTLTDRDWRDEITIERHAYSAVAQVDLSGIYYSGSMATSSAIFSLSPGHYPKHYGEKRQIQRIALDDQAEANTLAGLWLGYLNNEYPHVDVPMSSNYRAIDIAPRMFAQMNLAAGDTPRELVWTNKKLIPREVSFNYDARQAVLLTDITFEAETFASDAVTGDPPIEPPDPPIHTTPPPPAICNDPTALNFGGLEPCMYPELSGVVIAITTNYIGRCQDFFTASPATNTHWDNISTGLPVGCTMYNLAIGGSEGWLIVTDAGSYDLYYCDDLLAAVPNWSLVITTAQARTYPGVWVGHQNLAIAATAGGTCYLAAQQTPAAAVSYWRCVAGAVAGFESVNVAPRTGSCTGTWPACAACDDGVDVFFGVELNSIWISPTLGTGDWGGGLVGLFYAVSSAHGINAASNMYDHAGNFVRAGAYNQGQLSEQGSTFWIRAADGFLMANDSVQAVPDDTDGGYGVFSANGATISYFYAFGEGGGSEILLVAQSSAALNTKCSITYTEDGGTTWVNKDGDWATVFGAWEGGLNAMIRTTFV